MTPRSCSGSGRWAIAAKESDTTGIHGYRRHAPTAERRSARNDGSTQPRLAEPSTLKSGRRCHLPPEPVTPPVLYPAIMCVVCQRIACEGGFDATLGPPPSGSGFGAVAQLVEHLAGSQGVGRSSRLSSTDTVDAFTLGGFIAGEGCFSIVTSNRTWPDGDPVRDFVFKVSVASRDRALLESITKQLGAGSISDRPPRKTHWQPTSTFTVHSLRGHRAATIPFMDRFLIAGNKRQQCAHWKNQLLRYLEQHLIRAGGPRIECKIDGNTGNARQNGAACAQSPAARDRPGPAAYAVAITTRQPAGDRRGRRLGRDDGGAVGTVSYSSVDCFSHHVCVAQVA